MAKYNIIRNSLLESSTYSGTGNVDLTTLELSYLIDGNTTSSGVALSDLDVLYLDVDLGQRIKLSNILLYTNNPNKVSHIKFYYKNYEDDPYTICSIISNTNAYSSEIPEPSAPRYVRCTVSGVDITLNELVIYNDDTDVSFGEDGTTTSIWLEDTPLGDYGDPQEIPIYNSSDTSEVVTAYACVDYTGKNDDYIKISPSEDGDYIGIYENAVLGNSESNWNRGSFNNTKIEDNKLCLDYVGSSEVYEIGSLHPLSAKGCDLYAKPFGVTDGTCYDHINGIFYMAFYEGESRTGGTCKVYSYTTSTNTISGVMSFSSDYLDARAFSFTCDTENLYFFGTSTDEDYVRILYHDLTGEVNNITLLITLYVNNAYTYSRGVVADFSGNIYLYVPYYTNADSSYSKFIKMDVDTLTTTELSNDVGLSFAPTDYDIQLVYSFYDSSIHLLISNYSYKYTQRYDIATNSWSSSFFNYAENIPRLSHSNLRFNCFDGNLFFISPDYDGTVYIYNLSSMKLSSFDTGYSFMDDAYIYIQAIPKQDTLENYSYLIIGIADDYETLYGYNTFYQLTERQVISELRGEGTYTSDLLSISEPYTNSYLIVVTDSEEGITSVSLDDTYHDGTIEYRSSSTAPTPVDEVYWAISDYDGSDYSSEYYSYTVGTGLFEQEKIVSTYRMRGCCDTAVCRRTGRIAVFYIYLYYSYSYKFKVYDRDGSVVWAESSSFYSQNTACWDGDFGLWAFNNSTSTLNRFIASNERTCLNYSVDAYYDHAADLNDTNCWITETEANSLILVNSIGDTLLSVYLNSPRGVCSTEDGCCWVVDLGDGTYGDCVKKINTSGEFKTIVSLPESCYRITHDHTGGFYVGSSPDTGKFYHYDADGTLVKTYTGLLNYDYLRGGQRGFVVFNSEDNSWAYIDSTTGDTIFKTSQLLAGFSTTYGTGCPDIFSWDTSSEINYRSAYGGSILPVFYDDVWYGDALPWVEINKDGYFLPNHSNLQIRLTLRNFDCKSTPYVKKVYMAPAVKIKDIPPKESKPLYVRSSVPAYVDHIEFANRIKVWWSKEGE